MTYRMRTSPLETILLRLLFPTWGPRPMDLFCPGFESQSRSICSWDMACRDIFDDEIRKIRKHTCMILYGSFMFFCVKRFLHVEMVKLQSIFLLEGFIHVLCRSQHRGLLQKNGKPMISVCMCVCVCPCTSYLILGNIQYIQVRIHSSPIHSVLFHVSRLPGHCNQPSCKNTGRTGYIQQWYSVV